MKGQKSTIIFPKTFFISLLILFWMLLLNIQSASADSRTYYQVEVCGSTYYQNQYGVADGSYYEYGRDYYEEPKVFIETSEGNYYLIPGRDYSYEYYRGNEIVYSVKEVGIYKLVITGIGEYADEGVLRTINISIEAPNETDISDADIYLDGDCSYAIYGNEYIKYIDYDGLSHASIPVAYINEDKLLKNGEDYTYAYYKDGRQVQEVKEEGKYKLIITGKGYYSGEKEITIEIRKESITHNRVEVWKCVLNNKEKINIHYNECRSTKDFVPKLENKKLVEGVDYEYAYYQDGKKVDCSGNPGEYTLKITGAGKYKGEITLQLSIKKYILTKNDIRFDKQSFVYDKNKHRPVISVTASIGEEDDDVIVLKKGVDYTISEIKKQKTIGKYSFVVKGIGNYQGTIKMEWTIIPAKASFSLATQKNGIYVTPKAVEGATGYQIEYGTEYAWDYGETERIAMNKGTKTKLLSKKYVNNAKVYVRVRAYTTINGKRIYSNWSKKKSIRVKGPVTAYYLL